MKTIKIVPGIENNIDLELGEEYDLVVDSPYNGYVIRTTVNIKVPFGNPPFFKHDPKGYLGKFVKEAIVTDFGRSVMKETINNFYSDEVIEAMRKEPGGQFTGDDYFKDLGDYEYIRKIMDKKKAFKGLKEIDCRHCGFGYIPSEDYHHVVIVEDSGELFCPTINTTLHDSWDCPVCGGQFVGAERLADADDDEE